MRVDSETPGAAPQGRRPEENPVPGGPDTAEREDGVPEREDGVPEREPAPVPTAFGATSVGAAVAASAMADDTRRGDRSAQNPDPGPGPDPDQDPAGAGGKADPARGEPSLWDDTTERDLRDRWREVQLRFVDDPRGATGQAQALVGEAVDAFVSALSRRTGELDGWRSAGPDDTERLRVAVRGYRDLLNRLLNG